MAGPHSVHLSIKHRNTCSLRHKPKNNVVVKKYTLHYLREKNARMRRKLVMRCAREGAHRSIAHTKCEHKRYKNVEEWCA